MSLFYGRGVIILACINGHSNQQNAADAPVIGASSASTELRR